MGGVIVKNVKSMNDSLDMSYRLSHLPSGDEQIMRIDQKGKQISARDAVLPICVTAGKSGETSSLRDALQERQGNICLIGESGMGKTTAIIRILERHEMERSNGNSDVVPVFVGLNDAPKDAKWYQGDNGPESYFIRRGIACRCFGVNRISGISKDYDRRMDAHRRWRRDRDPCRSDREAHGGEGQPFQLHHRLPQRRFRPL